MRFSVLGPLLVADAEGAPVDVGGRQPRVVVVALVAAHGRPVTADALVEAIWGDEPPRSALGTLQTYVSRLRRTLDERSGPSLVLTDAGYVLDLAGHEVDVAAFERLADEGAGLLAAGRVADARAVLAAALGQWRGPALLELLEAGAGVAQAAALEERRVGVLEQRIEADLALGRHADVVPELQALVAEHPLRERLHAALALALYRSGRQADALRALAAARDLLREELGLEPTRALSDLETAILAHDPALEPPAVPEPVAGQAAGATGGRPTRIPLVGREAELAELRAALAEAADDARFVVLEGEPGIGKTRLADELAVVAAAAGSLVAWGRADESGAAPALWPWLPVLRATVAAALDDVPALLADVLAGEAPLLAGQGPALQFERFEAVADVLERAGKEQPAVVLLDDLQWADPASLDLLQYLATRLRGGVLVVGTVRTLAVGQTSPVTGALGAVARRHGSRRMNLRGLPAAATGTLLEAVATAPVDADLVARIHERVEGNPFYAIELARLLGSGDVAAEVPASVRDAIGRRLGLLPERTVEVLTVAAVVGRDVDLGLVARAAGIDLAACAEALDPAAAQRLLESSSVPGALRFSHALVREVLLEELTPLRRAGVHLQVADAMSAAAGGDDRVDRDQAEALAGHLWRAVPLGVGERAAAALERAAETATSRVAYVQAEELLGRAAQLRRAAGSSPEARRAELATLLRLLEVMQAIRYFSGTDREVLHRAMELAADLGLEDVSLKLEWSEWAALSTAAELAQARPRAEEYLRRWGEDPRPKVRIAANVLFGVDEWTRGRIPSAIEHLDRAIALLQETPPPEDAFEGEYQLVAHAFSLWSHAAHGDVSVEEALAGYDFLLAVVPPAAVSATCAFGGAVAAVHCRWDELDRLSSHALGADPAAQFAFFGGQLLMQRGVVAAARGELDEGVATFLEGRGRYRAVGGRTTIVTHQSLLAELLARAGRVSEAAELLVSARRQADSMGETWEEITLCIAEAVVATLAGDTATASERFAAALAEGERSGMAALGRRARSVAADLGVAVDA